MVLVAEIERNARWDDFVWFSGDFFSCPGLDGIDCARRLTCLLGMSMPLTTAEEKKKYSDGSAESRGNA